MRNCIPGAGNERRPGNRQGSRIFAVPTGLVLRRFLGLRNLEGVDVLARRRRRVRGLHGQAVLRAFAHAAAALHAAEAVDGPGARRLVHYDCGAGAALLAEKLLE